MNIGEQSDQKLKMVFKSLSDVDNFPHREGFHYIDLQVTIFSEDSIKMHNSGSDFLSLSVWFTKL